MTHILEQIRQFLSWLVPGEDKTFRFKEAGIISGHELHLKLQELNPDARVYIADGIYVYVREEELDRWLNSDSLDKMVWLTDVWDCDNFAAESFCRAHRRLGNIAYGIAWGQTNAGYHGFNVALVEVSGELAVRIIEPQNDDTRDWKKSDYKPDFIKI